MFVISDAGSSVDSIGWISAYSPLTTQGTYCGSPTIINAAGELTMTNYPADRKTLSVVTCDRTQNLCTVYRNATPIVTGNVNDSLTSTALSIGRFGACYNGYWYGTLADARIYDHALSQAEVNTLYAAGPKGDEKGDEMKLSPPPLSAILSCLPASLSRGFR